jgi:undecaprenyl diphosphate synthase
LPTKKDLGAGSLDRFLKKLTFFIYIYIVQTRMHVGIIMDGNRRWAKSRNLPSFLGHAKGAGNIEKIVDYASDQGADIITIYAMSSENFVSRSAAEVDNLTNLIAKYAIKMKAKLLKKDVKVKILGDISTLKTKTKLALETLMETTKDCSKTTLQVCINYGGRNEIIRAIQQISSTNQPITEDLIAQHLDSPHDLDLIIRTGGNHRLSNFMTWQSVYSELYFSDTLWPDFTTSEYQKALDYFHQEQRNHGK